MSWVPETFSRAPETLSRAPETSSRVPETSHTQIRTFETYFPTDAVVQTVIEISCHFGELASDKRLFLEVEHTFVPAGALLTLFGCALA